VFGTDAAVGKAEGEGDKAIFACSGLRAARRLGRGLGPAAGFWWPALSFSRAKP